MAITYNFSDKKLYVSNNKCIDEKRIQKDRLCLSLCLE